MPQSIDLDIRELRQARERLEDATKEWVLAYRLYVGAVDALGKHASKTGRRRRRIGSKRGSPD